MSELTPTQDLILEVLAARHRLGEPHWPFERRHRKALDALTNRGLISYESDVMPGLYRARLTHQGRSEALSATYVSPDAVHWKRRATQAEASVDALTAQLARRTTPTSKEQP